MIKAEVVVDNLEWKKKIINSSQLFNRILKNLPKKYISRNKKTIITVLLASNLKIKKLNKVFRKKNKPTDILSFPFTKKFRISKQTYLGDIIISYNFINKPKSLNTKLFKEKVIKIFIHGFLHLLGFDHKKNKDYIKMLKEEGQIYKSVISKTK